MPNRTDSQTPTRFEGGDWLHRVVVLTAFTGLFTNAVGTAVTSTKAGMAFPDWQTSDGYGMFTYPWLRSTGEKFLEHGHRLAGIAIGVASLVLCGSLALRERRAWVKSLGATVLAAVIVQGLLGGFRVLRNAEDLALVHGSGAGLVFALIVGVAVVTSRGWREAGAKSSTASSALGRLQLLAIAGAACVFTQYVLGGFLRHKGMLVHEHLAFAFVTAFVMIWLAISTAASGIAWLRGPALCIALLTVSQLGLGAAAWVTKFGFGEYVAVRGSNIATAILSLHVLTGALLLGSCVTLSVRIARLRWLMKREGRGHMEACAIEAGFELAGGAR